MSKELALLILSAMMLIKAGLYLIDDGARLVSDLACLSEEMKNCSFLAKTEEAVSVFSFIFDRGQLNNVPTGDANA